MVDRVIALAVNSFDKLCEGFPCLGTPYFVDVVVDQPIVFGLQRERLQMHQPAGQARTLLPIRRPAPATDVAAEALKNLEGAVRRPVVIDLHIDSLGEKMANRPSDEIFLVESPKYRDCPDAHSASPRFSACSGEY